MTHGRFPRMIHRGRMVLAIVKLVTFCVTEQLFYPTKEEYLDTIFMGYSEITEMLFLRHGVLIPESVMHEIQCSREKCIRHYRK